MTAPKISGEKRKTRREKLLEDLDNNEEAVKAVEYSIRVYLTIKQAIKDDPGPKEDRIRLTDISKHADLLSKSLERLPLTAKEGLEQGFFVTNRHFVDLTNVKENVDQLARAAKWYCDATGQRRDGRPKEWERLDLIRSLRDIYFDVFKKEPAHQSRYGPFTRVVIIALDAANEPVGSDRAQELIEEALEPPAD